MRSSQIRSLETAASAITCVGKCPACSSVHTVESATFLYSDETGQYCPCGGRLREAVAEAGRERRHRLIVPEELRDTGTRLRQRLGQQMDGEASVEFVEENRGKPLITLEEIPHSEEIDCSSSAFKQAAR